MRRPRFRAAALALSSLLAITACAGSPSPTAAPPAEAQSAPKTAPDADRPAIDAAVLRGNREGATYDVFPTIESLANEMPTVLAGEVVSWSDGAVLADHDERGYTAVLKLKVHQVWKGRINTKDGFAYVTRSRGGEVVDSNGKPVRNPGAPSSVTSIEQLEASVPAGAKVLFLGDAGTGSFQFERPPVVETLAAHAGYPDGARLLRPHAFGMLFEQQDGSLVSGGLDGEPWTWLSEGARVALTEQFTTLATRLRSHFK